MGLCHCLRLSICQARYHFFGKKAKIPFLKIKELIVAENQNLCQLASGELKVKVRMLREKVQLLQVRGGYVGEVIKSKVHLASKFFIDNDKNAKLSDYFA